MNYLIIVFLLISSIPAHSSDTIDFNRVCQNNTCINFSTGRDLSASGFTKDLPAQYISQSFDSPTCANENNCTLYLGFVADTYSISLNETIITDLITGSKVYSSHNSVTIPIPSSLFSHENNIIKIQVKDLNKYQWGLLNNIKITDYNKARYLSVKDWLLRTGFTIFSAYFVLIFSLLTLFTFFIIRNKNTLVIFLYCLASFFYLISFSEFPREVADPEILSGIIHFPLRLIQDVSLFYVFHRVLNREKIFTSFYRSVFILYAIALGAYLFYAITGNYEFSTAKQIILIAAPLVAMPMCYGFLLSMNLKKDLERSVLVPLFFVLFLFQLNDLFLFWQIINTFFTVKFYIPFIVILLAFIEIRQYSLDYTAKTVLADKVQNAKQIAHDIRSPLSALTLLSDRVTFKSEEKEVFIGVIQAIDGIASSLVQQTILFGNTKCNINSVVSKVLAQKKIEYPDLAIEYNSHVQIEELCQGDPLEIGRVLSNIINNAWEAMAEKPIVYIELGYFKNFIHIKIRDTGIGMPKHVMKKLGTFGFTYGKETHAATAGSGLGVYNAIKTIEHLGANFLFHQK